MDPRRLLPPLVVLAALSVALTGWVVWRPAPAQPSPTPSASQPAPVSTREPREVLRAWDDARAAAWAAGDPAALRRLYVRGSATARRDVRMLREYVARGLAVRGTRTQVLALEVVRRAPDRLRLRVTDRLVGGVVVDGDGVVQGSLPVDRPSTRLVTLRRVGGRWRVAEVADAQASAVATTDATSGSSNS